MAVWRDTTYTWHYPEKEEEAVLQDNGRVQAVAQVSWEGRQQARRDFCGTVAVADNGLGQQYITRTTPMPWPDEPWMYCTGSPRSVGLGPHGNDPVTRLARYHKCHLTLVYQALTYDVLEDADVVAVDGPLIGLPDEGDALRRGIRRYVSVYGKLGGKTWTVPTGILEFPDGQPILQATFGKRIPAIALTYTWHQVPKAAIPKIAWIEGQGTINDLEFDGWPAETLLVEAPFHSPPRRDAAGTRIVDITVPMLFQPNWDKSGVPRGHNYMLRATATGQLDYQLVRTHGAAPRPGPPNGDPPFRTFDFRRFFQPDQPVP
jgi:hypothetical protein